MDAATICPNTVATAAPAIPMRGIPKYPKIRIGSRMILMIAPVDWVIIVYMVLPVACSSLSKVVCRKIPIPATQQIVR